DTFCPCLHPACPGRTGLGRRYVLRLDDPAPGGHGRAGRPGPTEAVGPGVPAFLCLGLGRGGAPAGQRRGPDPVALQRLRDRTALCAGHDGAIYRDGCTVYSYPVVAIAGFAPRGGGPGLGGGCCRAGADSATGGDQSAGRLGAGGHRGGTSDVL
ncbi:hypothetical protein, partial [Pseudomonas sp. FEN]